MRIAIRAFALSVVFFWASNALGQSHTAVLMQQQGGTYVVPALINNAITLDFIVDSGSSDVSVPADVVLTLVRTGTINKSDFIGTRTYVLADGSKLPSVRFRLRSLKVGNQILTNVIASLAPSQGSLLLGQSFLSRFQSWSIDNTTHRLLLNRCCQSTEVETTISPELPNGSLANSPGSAATTVTTPIEMQLRNFSRQFIFSLYRQMSSPNDQAITTLGNIYADTVNYFGKEMTREQVIENEMAFLVRWPIRQYKPKDGFVSVNCVPSTLICSASGVLQFDARSFERNQRSVGEATFQYQLQFSSPYDSLPKVILENGHVFKRTIQVLSPNMSIRHHS